MAVTMGDPAGVGPEVLVKALSDPGVAGRVRPLVLGDRRVFMEACRRAGVSLEATASKDPPDRPGAIALHALSDLADDDRVPGRPTPAGGAAAAEYIARGADLALTGRVQGLVTGPISKEALNQAGYTFPGHTEFLAHAAGNPPVVMMLAGDRLKVVLVTIHEALSEVPNLVTAERIETTATITDAALKRFFNLPRPRLAMAALNPHAGEAGMFGREERDVLIPAARRCRRAGVDLSDPLPADTLFYRAVKGEFDAVVSMYHDQGLTPFKLLHFEDGVNTTLGLPFIRTSVDHGVAYDLAGSGRALPASMKAALRMAADMARAQNCLTT